MALYLPMRIPSSCDALQAGVLAGTGSGVPVGGSAVCA
jgi:hypothetical protein